MTDEPGFSIFDQGENALVHEKSDEEYSFAEIGTEYAALANRSQPDLRVMKEETHEDTCVARYAAKYSHDEARVTGDGEKAMIFSYDGLRIYDSDGIWKRNFQQKSTGLCRNFTALRRFMTSRAESL